MLGTRAGALHSGRPTYTRGRPTYPASASASARSNSIDSLGPNNIVICRCYSISRFEVSSDGNGDLS